MNVVRAVLLSLLAVGGMIAGVALAAGVTSPDGSNLPAQQVQTTSQEETSEAANDTFGSKISAFMQSNAAQTDGAVETGMWVVAFRNASNQSVQSALVEQQTQRIRKRLDAVESEKQRLIERRKAGEISQVEYESRMSTVIGSYLALTAAIDTTEPLAKQAGADGTEIAELRRNSRDFTGPEVAEVARDIGGARSSRLANGTGPGNAGLGPDDAPGRPDAPGNAPTDAGGNAVENATGAVGNATDTAVDLPAEAGNVTVGNGTNVSVGPPNGSNGANGQGDGRPGAPNETTTTDDGTASNESTPDDDTAVEYTEEVVTEVVSNATTTATAAL